MSDSKELLLLALDTSSYFASACLFRGTDCFDEVCVETRRPSHTLLPRIEDMLARADCSVSELGAVAVTTGPGSFTGIRVGMGAAQGLAQPFGLPLVPVCTLDAVAISGTSSEGLVCVLQDARRERVYAATYDLTEDLPVRQGPILDVSPSEFLRGLTEPVALLGDIFAAQPALAGDAPNGSRVLSSPSFLSRAVGSIALQKFRQGETVRAGELVPEYVRDADAKLPTPRSR